MKDNVKKFIVYVIVALLSAISSGITTYLFTSCSTTLNAEKLEFSAETKIKEVN